MNHFLDDSVTYMTSDNFPISSSQATWYCSLQVTLSPCQWSYHTGHWPPGTWPSSSQQRDTFWTLDTRLRPASEICVSISADFGVEGKEKSWELFLFAIISCVWELIIEGEIWCNVISVVSYPRNDICIFLQNDFSYLFFSPPPQPSHIPDVHHLHHIWFVSHLKYLK